MQNDEPEKTKQQEPPSLESLAECGFRRNLRASILAWREAGKPHKR